MSDSSREVEEHAERRLPDVPLKIQEGTILPRLMAELPPSVVSVKDLVSGFADAPERLVEEWGHQAYEPMRVTLEASTAEEAFQEAFQEAFSFQGHQGDLLLQLGEDLAPPPPEWAEVTTVMMRNLPNKYTQRMLLMEVNHSGFLGTFDFLYLPIDSETAANRGYAFLNFLEPWFAWMFRSMYEGRRMSRFNSKKVISVVPATLQGFDANYSHYSGARATWLLHGACCRQEATKRRRL
ncbi:unnamed protein product [Effrenium voratum]|nr:unnamed protein product [Effrenium voratum]